MQRRTYRIGTVVAATLCCIVLYCPVASASAAPATRGNASLTVLAVNSTWPGLLPATDNQDAANYNYLNAIYGQLFEQGPHGTILDDEATGYKFSNHNMTVTVNLRHGMKFSDGTPFTSQAVVDNINSDLLPSNGCICDFDWSALKSVATNGPYSFVLTLSRAFPPIIDAFIGEAPNWTPSPSALASEGQTAFAQNPVGAGPFQVVSNTSSETLVLRRYSGYWKKTEPYLESLTFTSVANDQSAYSALEAGETQIVTGMTTVPILREATKSYKVPTIAGTGVSAIQFNTLSSPFNNITAREAIYYATNETAILNSIDYKYGKVTESPAGPGGLFYEAKVPGYRSYDLAKAKSLVQSLGGLKFTLMIANTVLGEQLGSALLQQWAAAGMNVTLNPESFTSEIGAWIHHSYQISTSEIGGPDPSVGVETLGNNVGCHGTFSSICDSTLDSLITRLSSIANPTARNSTFDQIAALIAKDAYVIYGVVTPWNMVADRSVTGLNMVSGEDGPIVNWETVK